MSGPRKYNCGVEWCGKAGYANGYCKHHYYQHRKYGRILPKRDVNGRRKHPLYGAWAGMVNRCHNPNNSAYGRYGARGVFVCDRWRYSFDNFLADMGERPEGMTLDRVDPKGPYAPDNCRWATIADQRRNISPEGDRRMREAMSAGIKRRWREWREARDAAQS